LVKYASALGFNLILAVGVGVGFVRNRAQPFLGFGAEFVGFGAELFIAELPHLGFERINRLNAREQTLDFAFVLCPENLAQ